jgi:hypothetical protein
MIKLIADVISAHKMIVKKYKLGIGPAEELACSGCQFEAEGTNAEILRREWDAHLAKKIVEIFDAQLESEAKFFTAGAGDDKNSPDVEACLASWGGCDETHHNKHECHRDRDHDGQRHQCLCGVTAITEVRDE